MSCWSGGEENDIEAGQRGSGQRGSRGGVRGAILAGGGATRFEGKPKGLELVGGERILDRLVRAMTAALGEPPLLVANAPDAESWRPDLRTVGDARPGFGSLGGIYTAVAAAPAPVVCVAWDMPFVSESLIQALAEGLEQYDAMLPQSDGQRGVEPLCAAYGPACQDAIAASLAAGDLRAIGFHDRIRVGILPLERVRTLADPDLLFFNVNTADDLARADQLWRRRASSP
jgi:molybdopterin-guanine dinucleotide biosynthesis protein A